MSVYSGLFVLCDVGSEKKVLPAETVPQCEKYTLYTLRARNASDPPNPAAKTNAGLCDMSSDQTGLNSFWGIILNSGWRELEILERRRRKVKQNFSGSTG